MSRLARSAGLIGAATMTSRILGVARETVLAALFGAGNDMDAFNVAFRIPNLLRDLFAEGAISAALVPTFTRRLEQRGRDSAWRLGNLVVNTLVAITCAVVLAGWIAAPWLARAFAPEFALVPGKLALTVLLIRIMLPFLTLLAIGVAMMGMLNALRRFFVPAVSPAMFNLAMLFAAFALVPLMPRLGWPRIAAIAIGTILGGLGQIAIQWPLLRREGWRYRPIIDLHDDGLREVMRLVAPATIGLAAVQINVFVNTVLATGEGTGAVSWLNYAFRLMYLPIGLFGVSIGTAALPEISRHTAVSDTAGLRRTVAEALRLTIVLNVPATIGLMVLSRPIVSLLLERGRVGPDDTAATATALMCYAPGLVGYAVVKIASPTFYALRDPRTPVVVTAVAVVVNIVLNLLLVRTMGFAGLALGATIAALVHAGVLLWRLRDRVGSIGGRENLRVFVLITIAAVAMGAGAWGSHRVLEALVVGRSTIVRALRVFTSISVGLAILVGAAHLLRVDEFKEAVRRVASRLGGS